MSSVPFAREFYQRAAPNAPHPPVSWLPCSTTSRPCVLEWREIGSGTPMSYSEKLLVVFSDLAVEFVVTWGQERRNQSPLYRADQVSVRNGCVIEPKKPLPSAQHFGDMYPP